MTWQSAIERTVAGLGYDLVDAEKSAGGLLRVYIDHPAAPAAETERFITVEDCEAVTRQLQHVLEVENVDYARLEVSSPGLDRPLRKAADYARFVGAEVEVTLKMPFEGRKRYRGELRSADDAAAQPPGNVWRLVLKETPAAGTAKDKPARAPKKAAGGAAEAAPERALDFLLDEVREARLVPVVDFKGRRTAAPTPLPAGGCEPAADAPEALDGGRS